MSATETHELRTMMGVARKLRGLAQDTLAAVDRDLYLTAAAALEARAHWLAETLPEDRVGVTESHAHQHVDLLI